MNGANGHHHAPTEPPQSPEQELLTRAQRSPVVVLVALLGGMGVGGAGGYGAARVEQVQRQAAPSVPAPAPAAAAPVRVRPLILADKACSPPCSKKQTCYKGTCVDVATSVQQRLQVLEAEVQRLAGADDALSAGAMR